MAHRWKGNINRAILDAAASFNNLGKVAEEYLTNILDAFETILHDKPDKNIKRSDCKVQFIIDHTQRKIIFHDEHPLMGMSSNFIYNNFFNIHGQNISRKRYINVRGKHGTGKSAAFGIGAEYLLVDSIYREKRTTIKSTLESLQNEDTEAAELDVVNDDESVNIINGTTIELKLPNKKYLELRAITSALLHIQKVFGKHLNSYKVDFIEIHNKGQKQEDRIIYQPRESVYEKEYSVPQEIAAVIGQTYLIVKRAAEPMEDTEEKGITITSNGYAKEQTMFGLDNEPYSNHFFGEWEIPKLDEYKGHNPPSLSTRELKLNRENELVKVIYEFGKKILSEEIKNFAKNERIRKQDETLTKLSNMANELANILNDDFSEYEEISKKERGEKGKVIKKDTPEEGATSTSVDIESNVISKFGSQIKVEENNEGELISPSGEGEFPAGAEGNDAITDHPSIHAGPLEKKFEELPPNTKNLPNAEKRARRRVRAGGGFKIEFAALNHNVFIARVDITTKIITVNIDSEVMKTHLTNCGGNEEYPSFKMFAYSVAIDEYSRAVVNIMAANHEFYGTSMEEILQEGVTEMGVIKKRVMDKLSITLSQQYESET